MSPSMRSAKGSILCLGATLLASAPTLAQADARQQQLAPLGVKPAATEVTALHDGRQLEVKFVDGSGVRLRDGKLVALVPTPLAGEVQAIDLLLESVGARRERVFDQSEQWLESFRLRGEARGGRALHDLNLFFRVELEDAGVVGELCDALNDFSVVELAYPIGSSSDPVITASAAPAAGITPDFEGLQGYRRAAPLGIDADYGNTFSGGIGTGITIADVETGWTDDHEDIAHKAEDAYIGFPAAFYPWDHGTAVLGELVGADNGFGVRGSVPDADVLLSSHQGVTSQIPTAIATAAGAVGVGDVVVIEVQCFGSFPAPFPCELVPSIYATVETATANGIHVFAAAGNGSNNMDSSAYQGLLDRTVRDSGAVIVCASNGSLLSRASFSNYGTRCDAQGWGFDVTTAGYGDLYNGGGPRFEYTDGFSGTSSATPIVTGAGMIIDGVHRSAFGSGLDPLALRGLITQTGTPQTGLDIIGPRPNVRAALLALGVPRIELGGDTSPGGPYVVTAHGDPGDLSILFFAPGLRSTPLPLAPYGWLLLQGPYVRVLVGTLDAQGQATYLSSVPGDAIPGTTLGYYQGWQRYQSGAGVGTFTNYEPLVVQ